MSTPQGLFNRLNAQQRAMSDESDSEEETFNVVDEDISTITGTLKSDATNGSSLEELRKLSLEDLIKQYAVEQYFAQKLLNTKEVIKEKIIAKYSTLAKLHQNEETIRSLMMIGLRPSWPEESVEYERLKEHRKGWSKEETALKENLKKIRNNLVLQAKRFFALLVEDVFGKQPVAVVEKTPPAKVVGGIVNYYDGLGQIAKSVNPNFDAHKIKIPFRMVISAPAGSGNMLVFVCSIKVCLWCIISCCCRQNQFCAKPY
jgi:hypothetical protein